MLNVRNYNERDLQKLISVYQSVFAEPPWNETWSAEDIKEDLNFALSQVQPIALVAEQNNQFTGFSWGYKLPFEYFPFLAGKVNPHCSYLDEIAVIKTARKQGIGKILGNVYFSQARQMGIDNIVLRTDERNKASMALFDSLGFKLLGVRDPKYPNRQYLVR